MRRTSRAVFYSLVGLLVAVAVEACGASADKQPGGPVQGSGGSGGLGDMDATTVDAPTEGGMGGAPSTEYDALCGVVLPGGCVPDDVNACLFAMGGQSGRGAGGSDAGTAGSQGSGGAGNASGFAGEAGGAGDGGEGGEGGVGQAGSAPEGPSGSSGTAGSSGAGAVSGNAGTSGNAGMSGGGGVSNAGTSGGGGVSNAGTSGSGGEATGLPRYACQVGVRRSEPHASCVLSGPGGVDAPCLSSSDCQASLACVGKVAGRCRPYCCDHSACIAVAGTHCATEPLLGVGEVDGEPPAVPVCVPAAECSLAEDYPCKGSACTCPDDTACMVVSDEGKTSCVVPGDGATGRACPCKWGHVCSKATNECVKLCQTAAPGDDCGSGRCQAAPVLPPGWGVCVGYVPEDAG